MKRHLCFLTIILIIIILGLFKLGIALFEYKGIREGDFEAVIEKELKQTQYMKSYIAKINNRKFIIYIKNKSNNLQIGNRIIFNGIFSEGEHQRNFGGFDYNLYLKTKKIWGTFKVENYSYIGEEYGIRIKFKKLISVIQNNIIKTFKNNLKSENYGLISGLLIGDTTNISEKTINNFRESNLTHVLAISGSNFVLIIKIIDISSKKIKHKKIEHIVSIISIIFFMELTGNTPSVIRAGTMSVLLILSKILHRKYDFWTSLAISTLIQLLYNPYTIFDLGLILSYSGVIGLVLFNEKIQNKIKLSTISTTLSANILIIPIMAYNFNTVSLTFVISNMLAELLIIPITVLGLISIVFKFQFIFIILDCALNIFRKIAELCAQIPFSTIYVTTPSLFTIICYYIFLLITVLKPKMKCIKKITATILIILLISNQNYEIIKANVKGELLINFVDVGQGDCTLIRTGGKNILIDGGGSSDSKYDVGKRTLIPYLLDRKIKTLDYIIISHFDTDHVRPEF